MNPRSAWPRAAAWLRMLSRIALRSNGACPNVRRIPASAACCDISRSTSPRSPSVTRPSLRHQPFSVDSPCNRIGPGVLPGLTWSASSSSAAAAGRAAVDALVAAAVADHDRAAFGARRRVRRVEDHGRLTDIQPLARVIGLRMPHSSPRSSTHPSAHRAFGCLATPSSAACYPLLAPAEPDGGSGSTFTDGLQRCLTCLRPEADAGAPAPPRPPAAGAGAADSPTGSRFR